MNNPSNAVNSRWLQGYAPLPAFAASAPVSECRTKIWQKCVRLIDSSNPLHASIETENPPPTPPRRGALLPALNWNSPPGRGEGVGKFMESKNLQRSDANRSQNAFYLGGATLRGAVTYFKRRRSVRALQSIAPPRSMESKESQSLDANRDDEPFRDEILLLPLFPKGRRGQGRGGSFFSLPRSPTLSPLVPSRGEKEAKGSTLILRFMARELSRSFYAHWDHGLFLKWGS